MNFIRKTIWHLQRRTLLKVILRKLGVNLDQGVWAVKWYGTKNADLAVRYFIAHAQSTLAKAEDDSAWVMSLGDSGRFHSKLNSTLKSKKINFKVYDIEFAKSLNAEESDGLVGIYCGCTDARKIMECAKCVRGNSVLAEHPFEYIAGLNEESTFFERFDEYADNHFISPLLLEFPTPYKLYEESLEHFSQKCGLRDYLDLYQVIKTIVDNNVPGDIAEFGSYEGHSGWLIARTLQVLGSDKHLYMFDAFESFPAEELGVDKFWSRTHQVDFEEVKGKLAKFDKVSLIQGDFTKTLDNSGISNLSLAYIDCDSYRATRFLFDAVLDGLLSNRGAIVCEDYGHPALLGSRMAVHDGLIGRLNILKFFSQFSGLYIAFKT